MIFYFIIEEPLFANLQKKFHTLFFDVMDLRKLQDNRNDDSNYVLYI